MAEQGGASRKVFRLDEQFAEGGMRGITGGGREDDLGITRQIDFTNTCAVIAHGDAAHFDVIFCRHGDVELCRHIVIPAAEDCAFCQKRDAVVLRRLRRRIGGR